jgi:hypothetical protein
MEGTDMMMDTQILDRFVAWIAGCQVWTVSVEYRANGLRRITVGLDNWDSARITMSSGPAFNALILLMLEKQKETIDGK